MSNMATMVLDPYRLEMHGETLKWILMSVPEPATYDLSMKQLN